MTDSEKTSKWVTYGIPTILAALIAAGASIIVKSMDSSSTSAPTITVDSVTLSSTATQFTARCPLTLRFDGAIEVSDGSGSLSYRFDHSDGFGRPTTRGSVRTAKVSGPDTIRVSDEWTPNVPYGTVARTTTLVVVSPKSATSSPVTIQGVCDARLPENPPAGPPDVASTP